jgi:hypothetical protein
MWRSTVCAFSVSFHFTIYLFGIAVGYSETLYTCLALAPYRDDLMPLARAKVAFAECESSRVPQRIEYWTRIHGVAQKELSTMPPILMNAAVPNTNTETPAPSAGDATATTDSKDSGASEAAVHQLKFWTQVANTAEKELKSAISARDNTSAPSAQATETATTTAPTKLKPKIK